MVRRRPNERPVLKRLSVAGLESTRDNYNNQRPHTSIDMRTPDEYAKELERG